MTHERSSPQPPERAPAPERTPALELRHAARRRIPAAGAASPPPPRVPAPRFDFAALAIHREPPALQLHTSSPGSPGAPREAMYAEAVAGVSEAGQPLPHRASIQRAFGPAHDLTRISAHVGGRAGEASARLGADGYAVGEHVAFHRAPDLRLAAHEAAHVVQQRAGVQLRDRIGRPGDRYEQHADAVADAVVAGRSAVDLLGAPARSAGPAGVQMQWAHTQHPGMPAYPAPNDLNTPSRQIHPRALAALANEVVDLQGVSRFTPSYWLAVGMAGMYPQPVFVRARFGSLAIGVLKLKVIPSPVATLSDPAKPSRPAQDYETASGDELLELQHPSFPGGGLDYPARLRIDIRDSVVTGRVSFDPGQRRLDAIGSKRWTEGFDYARLFGWRGLSDVRAGTAINELRGGVLRYELPRFEFRASDATRLGGKLYDGDDALAGVGAFRVVDDRETFSAQLTVEGEGIAAKPMPLRKLANGISGAAKLDLKLAPVDAFGGVFSGAIEGNFAGGLLTLQGTARYQSPRANGQLTVLLAPRAAAWARVAQLLPPQPGSAAPVIRAPGAPRPRYALVGWGTVNFALNEWLTGNVSAVLDPDGYITSHGVLRPTREFQFLEDSERTAGPWTRKDQIGRTLEGKTPWVPVFGFFGIGGHASAKAFLKHGVGPGRVHDVEVQGRFSTRPRSVLEASATGRITVGAWAKLKVELGSGIHFSVAGDVVKAGSVDIEGTGLATARAYVELQPRFERFADPAHPDQASFRISGALRAGGSVALGLSGKLVVRVAYVPIVTLNLGNYHWNLGSLDIESSFSHVLGARGALGASAVPHGLGDAELGTLVEDLLHERAPKNPAGGKRHDATLGQDKTTAPASPRVAPTVVARPFQMNNAPHVLSVTHEPEAVLRMHSSGNDPLDDKLAAEEASVEAAAHRSEGPAAEALADEAAAVERLLAQARAVERGLDALSSGSRDATDVAGLTELVDGLTTYGTQYQRSDLGATSPQPITVPAAPVTDAPTPATPAPKPETEGARLAREAGYPPAEPGYHWAAFNGTPVYKNNPGNKGSKRYYDAAEATFKDLPGQWSRYKYSDLGKKEPCFAPGTLVKTPSGDRAIETLREGDEVFAFDAEANQVVTRRVTAVIANRTAQLVRIAVGGEQVLATRLHRFWVDAARQYLPAMRLEAGTALLALDGELVPIEAIALQPTASPTFNLEVERDHNYFVGERGVLVHNGRPSEFANQARVESELYAVWDTVLGKYIYVGQTLTSVGYKERFKQHKRKKPAWKAREDELEIRLLIKRHWSTYETAVQELHNICKKTIEGHPLENNRRYDPIGEDKFEEFQDLHNPCR